MSNNKVYLTAEGLDKLRAQLVEMRTVKRPEVLAHVRAVSGGADWRESPEQFQARDELARVDLEIRRLAAMLSNTVVVEPQTDDTVVDIGETVVLETNSHVETYTIVGPTEIDPDAGRISYESPVGHALLKHKVGDELDVQIPAGSIHYRIIAVQ